MDESFWHARWRNGQIGFHQSEVNQHLCKYWPELAVNPGGRVLVPLCGKSMDMLWLYRQGCSVAGIELNASACEAFFAEHGLQPEKKSCERYLRFVIPSLEVWCGDFFRLQAEDLSAVSVVYDRAALVAMPEAMRLRYAETLVALLPPGVKMLLVTLQRATAEGPPFTVNDDEVIKLFQGRFKLQRLDQRQAEDRPEWQETVWYLEDASSA
ncbi:thiopurine S-methyltransferase [Pontibacter sp. JAM-7]|uniref:thiopurine S-methyltransferase n=1 Tax=Pontibacter sp. JAM-7 TaxID=3366581 RepID=UPI003AF9D1A1